MPRLDQNEGCAIGDDDQSNDEGASGNHRQSAVIDGLIGLAIAAFIWMVNPNDAKEPPNGAVRSKFCDPLVWATFAISLATAVGVVVACLQWRTLEKTDATLKAAQRPWLDIRSPTIQSNLLFNDNKIEVTIGYKVENVGNSPAIHTEFFANPYPVWFDQDATSSAPDVVRKNGGPGMILLSPEGGSGENIHEVETASALMCDQLSELKSLKEERANLLWQQEGIYKGFDFHSVGTAIFPKIISDRSYQVSDTVHDRPKLAKSYILLLNFCARYVSEADKTAIHHTPLLLIIDRDQSKGPNIPFTLDPQMSEIQASDLRLSVFGNYAD